MKISSWHRNTPHWETLLLLIAATFSMPTGASVLELVESKVETNLFGARVLALSGDGRFLYVGGSDTLLFERDQGTGELSFVDATKGADTLSISPDGSTLYSAERFGSLRAARRHLGSGALTFLEEWDDQMSGLRSFSPWEVISSPDGLNVYVVTLDSTLEVFGREPGSGVLSWIESQIEGIDGVTGIRRPRSVAISPDGRTVYVVSNDSIGADTVAVFARDLSTGRLDLRQVLSDEPVGIPELTGSGDVLASVDGRAVYVTGSNGTLVFARDQSSGELSLLDVEPGAGVALAQSSDGRFLYAIRGTELDQYARNPIGGALVLVESISFDIDGFESATAIAVSADDRFLYVASPRFSPNPHRSGVIVLERNAVTDRLSVTASFLDDVEGDADGIAGARSVATSPDGRHVYAVDRSYAGAVAVFSRASESGRLQFDSMYDQLSEIDGLQNAESLAISPDGSNIYLACAQPGHTLVVLGRDQQSGELSHVETHFDGVAGVDGLEYSRSVVVSPDGRNVYSAGSGDNAVAVFARDPATGRLEFLEAIFDDLEGVDGLAGVRTVAISPDGEHVYAVGAHERGLAVFARDAATGRLEFREAYFSGVDGIEGLGGTPFATVSPDGRNVYVGIEAFGTLSVFARDPASGSLSYLEAHPATSGEPVVSHDGKWLYSIANHVSVFLRDSHSGRLQLVESPAVPADFYVRGATQSPDGDFVYAVGSHLSLDAVLVFRRFEGPCREGSYTGLCLASDRFQVRVDWRDFDGNTGSARAVPSGSDDSGLLWFFSETNWEMLIKVLDGCGFNDRYWVFAAATTDVEYTLQVTDVVSGVTKSYFNALGQAAAAITDTDAFATCDQEARSRSFDASSSTEPLLAGSSLFEAGRSMALHGGESEVDSWSVTERAPDLSMVPGKGDGTGLLIGLGGKCLDVQGGGTSAGTPVNIYECHREANQRWRFDARCMYSCPSYYEVIGIGEQCLQPGPTGQLVMGDCGGPEDRWDYQETFPAQFSLYHPKTGMCADVQGNSTANRTPVNLYECHGEANQLWRYDKIECVGSPVNLCLSQDRFHIEVEWRDFAGRTGVGRVLPHGSDDSGLFWFFSPDNWELLIKVLDGCQINDRFWVFAAATTDVEYILRVTDTETGTSREYFNPLGSSAAAITDTQAFASCDR